MIKKKRDWRGLVLPSLLLAFGIFSGILIYLTTAGQRYTSDNHLVLLAERLGKWKLTLDPANHPAGDYVDYEGRVYLYFGPVASLVLVPLVMVFGASLPQILIGIVSWVGVFWLVYRVAEKLGYTEVDSLWWAVFFGLSTVMFSVSVINITAMQVQALGVLFSWLFIDEYVGRKRWWLMSLWIAVAGMTRMSLFLMVGFLAMEWWRKKEKWKKLVEIGWPVFGAVVVLALYNLRRFGSLTESGYAYNVTLANYPMSSNIAHGFLSLKHVPANLYSMLLKGFDPIFEPGGGFVLAFPWFRADPWGLSLFITSPLYLLLVVGKKVKQEFSLWVSVGLLALPSLLYFGVGYVQFGYRYALDFLPVLTLLLMLKLNGKLSSLAKSLIVIGVLVNCLYLTSMWEMYPHFLAEVNKSGEVVFGWK